jgi:hypothetical protein
MKIRSLLSVGLAAAIFAASGGSMAHAQHGRLIRPNNNLPPAQRLLEPGPGVGGPGPGVLGPNVPAGFVGGGGGYPGGGAPCADGGPGAGPGYIAVARSNVQILFVKPEAMQVRWDTTGQANFDGEPLVAPARYNFPQDGIYRLKITNIGGREGVELYPTLEIGPTTARTDAFLAHNAIPVQFTEEDFDQVLAGNFVTKVIYLPDPEFQELALAGVETLVSTRLEPGVDPITEADRRGSIMAIIRLGNKDVELPGSNGGAIQAGFLGAGVGGYGGGGAACGHNGCGPDGCSLGGGDPYATAQLGASGGPPAHIPPPFVAGVTAPEYGMTSSGTPIGLPGPPHIPFGGQAGLRTHTMWNHTQEHYPHPTAHLKYHVKYQPGYSYPRPPSTVYVREQNFYPAVPNRQPPYYWSQRVGDPAFGQGVRNGLDGGQAQFWQHHGGGQMR